MVQRKYIGKYVFKILLLANLLYPTLSHGVAWLPDAGSYKISSSVLFTDNTTKSSQKTRMNILVDAYREMGILLQKDNLTKTEKRELSQLEAFCNNYDSFNDEIFIGNEIEYGISKKHSLGLKVNFNIEKNLRYIYNKTGNEDHYFTKRTTKEIGFYYKYLLYKTDNWQLSLVPEFIDSRQNKLTKYFSTNIGTYLGYSKLTKSGKKLFSEFGFNVGRTYNLKHKNLIFKKFFFLEGIEIAKGFFINNYFEYSFTNKSNMIYSSMYYEQLAVAKETVLSDANQTKFTAQIGYYWKRSLSSNIFRASGPVFSIWLTL